MGPLEPRKSMDLTIELRLKKLMLFRLVMVTTLLFVAAYVEAVSETLLPVNPLYFLIGSYLSEGLRHAGQKLEEAAGEVADLRELNQLIVSSIQSGLMTTDDSHRILFVNRFGETILGQPAAAVRGRRVGELFASSLLEPRPEAGPRTPTTPAAPP